MFRLRVKVQSTYILYNTDTQLSEILQESCSAQYTKIGFTHTKNVQQRGNTHIQETNI